MVLFTYPIHQGAGFMGWAFSALHVAEPAPKCFHAVFAGLNQTATNDQMPNCRKAT